MPDEEIEIEGRARHTLDLIDYRQFTYFTSPAMASSLADTFGVPINKVMLQAGSKNLKNALVRPDGHVMQTMVHEDAQDYARPV